MAMVKTHKHKYYPYLHNENYCNFLFSASLTKKNFLELICLRIKNIYMDNYSFYIDYLFKYINLCQQHGNHIRHHIFMWSTDIPGQWILCYRGGVTPPPSLSNQNFKKRRTQVVHVVEPMHASSLPGNLHSHLSVCQNMQEKP